MLVSRDADSTFQTSPPASMQPPPTHAAHASSRTASLNQGRPETKIRREMYYIVSQPFYSLARQLKSWTLLPFYQIYLYIYICIFTGWVKKVRLAGSGAKLYLFCATLLYGMIFFQYFFEILFGTPMAQKTANIFFSLIKIPEKQKYVNIISIKV